MTVSKGQRGVAVIGCGDMGSQHIRSWNARPDAIVLAVYDPIRERAESVAAQIGVRACSSFEEAILHEGVECVSVATPVAFHAEISVFASEHGRHVLSEKPIALTLTQAESMNAAAKANNVRLAVSYQYRAFPRNQKLRDLFLSGAFGGPVFARYMDVREVRPKIAMHRQSMNGGPIIDMAGHFFDLMRFFTGSEAESVFASGHVFGRGKVRLAQVDDYAIDAAAIDVRYAGGHTLSVFANWGMPEGFPVRSEEYFVGPVMSARAEGAGLVLQNAEGLEEWRSDQPAPTGPSARIADLINTIETGDPLEVSGNDGIAALRISIAALESIQSGEAIRIRVSTE